jgi:hypothetical protein
LGATQAGLVFNRALMQDLNRSVSHVSIHAESLRALPVQESAEAQRPFAPLATALGECHPSSSQTDDAPESDHRDGAHQLS